MAAIVEADATARTARVTAKGADAKDRGQAQAEVAFSLAPDGAATTVVVDTDLALTGSVAQYGRAAGLIDEIAKQLIAEFVANLAATLEAPPAADTTVLPAAPVATPVSGGRLLWRALVALLRRWFGGRRGLSG